MNDNKFLITGGTGFIGSFIVDKIAQPGNEVHVIAHSDKNIWRLSKSVSVKIHYIDLLDFKGLVSLVHKINPTFVIHLAATVNPERNPDKLSYMIQVNLIGTQNLLTALQDIPYKLLINTGTCEEYGTGTVPFHENQRECPVSPYSLSKVCSTYLCSMHSSIYNKPIITVRPFLTYGPKQVVPMLIPQLITAGLLKKEMLLTKGEQTRDFIYVKDVADAYYEICENYQKIDGYQIYNIGSGIEIQIKNVIQMIESFFPHNLFRIGALPYREGESMHFYSSIDKISKLSKWKPRYHIKEGISETMVWWNENRQLANYVWRMRT